MKKRFISMLLSLCMVISIFSVMPISTNAETDGYYTYKTTGKYATITSVDKNISGDIQIPETVGGCIVEAIGNDAFKKCTNITSVTIPSSVESIGRYAFNGCTSLSKVTIPSSVTKINGNLFSDCPLLKTAGPIGGNYNIEFGWSSTIPDYAFATTVGQSYLSEIIIPDTVTHIGEYAFQCCYLLENVDIPNSVRTMGKYAFRTCKNLKSVKLSNKLEKIGNYAFSKCENLLSITFPDTMTTLGQGAFQECNSLNKVIIPEGLINFGPSCFSDSPQLTSAGPIGSGCNIEFGWKTTIPKNAFDSEFGQSYLSDISIPDTIVSIGREAFHGCVLLENIVLPDSVKTIDEWGFKSCKRLNNITWSKNLESIGVYSFSKCEKLTTVILPESMKKIGQGAFQECNSLSRIVIPASVNIMGVSVFADSPLLSTAGPIGGNYNIEFGWKEIIPANAFESSYGQSYLTKIIIPNSVMSIGKDAFNKCSLIESIILPKNLTNIEKGLFTRCSHLKEIYMQNSVINISGGVFNGCDKLTDIYYSGAQSEWENINIKENSNEPLFNATVHYNSNIPNDNNNPIQQPIIEQKNSNLTISTPTNSYAGTYYTFEATFDTMQTTAFLQFDAPDNNWQWLSDEYCSTNPVFNIPSDEIVEKDGKYVYQTSFVIYSSGNASDSYNRQVRVAADINGTRQYSEGAKFVVKPTPAKAKNTIGYLYEQTSNPSGKTKAPKINNVEVSKNGSTYRLTVDDFTAHNKEWVFFYWQTDNGEFEKVTDDFKTVDLTVSGDANVTVTMGDGCGYITTKTIEIN